MSSQSILWTKLTRTGTRARGPPRPSLPPATSSCSYALEDSVGKSSLPRNLSNSPSQQGQGGEGEAQQRDLRAELLQAEAAHFARKNGVPAEQPIVENAAPKRQLEGAPDTDGAEAEEDPEAKRRRILEETREIDADSEGSEDDSSEEESDDEEDEAAELMRELEKIKKERQEQKEKEARAPVLRVRPTTNSI